MEMENVGCLPAGKAGKMFEDSNCLEENMIKNNLKGEKI